MKNKKAISLIVLVITILVLSILATTVIMSLSNSNVINEAQSSVNKYNIKQIESGIQLEKASMMIETGGEEPNVFELIERAYTKGIITAAQREEMIKNGGELVIGDEMLRLDVDNIIFCKGVELYTAEAPYAIRFKFGKNTFPDNFTFNEFGFVGTRKSFLDSKYSEISAEKKFKLEAKETYGIAIVTGIGSESVMNGVFQGLPAGYESEVVAGRAYIKYTYGGIDGIIYSDIQYASVDSLK